MTTYRTDTEVVEPLVPGDPAVHTQSTEIRRVGYARSPLATLERWVVFIFGLIELLIGLRILLLLIAARESNSIVSFIYSLSDIFVAPFRGILGINEVQAGASALDVGAIVALVGWFILELIVIALVRVFRPSATV